MTALDLPNRGVHTGRRVESVRGRWSLAAGGSVETRARGRGWNPAQLVRRTDVRTHPLVSGALIVGDPVHLTGVRSPSPWTRRTRCALPWPR